MIADIFAAAVESPILDGIEQYLGGEFLGVNTTAQRIVWVPTNDSFRPGRIQTGLEPGDRDAPPSVYTRVAGVRCRVWGKADPDDPDITDGDSGNVADTPAEVRACEDLMRRLIVAVHDIAYGTFSVASASWVEQDESSMMQYGRAIDVLFTFEIPIYRTLAEGGTAVPIVENLEQEGTMLDEVETSTTTLDSIDVTPVEPEIDVDETVQMEATGTYSDDTTADVTAAAVWASDTPAVATVDQNGLVTGVAPGTANISATIAGPGGPVSGAQPVTVV